MKSLGKSVVVAMILTFLSGGVAVAQDKKVHEKPTAEQRKEHFEKIEAAKKEFFSKKLELTEKEADKFWALYKEYTLAERKTGKEIRELNHELKLKGDSLSEKDIKAKVEKVLDLEAELINLKKKYVAKASDLLGYKRAVASLSLDHEFKRELMARVKEEGKGPQKDFSPRKGTRPMPTRK